MVHPRSRERVLQTAQSLFHAGGYANTGLSEVLRVAGAGASSLYHFFPSKEALLLAVLEELAKRLEEEILAPSREIADPIERVFAVLGFYRRFLEASECSLGCPVGNLAGELADSHPRVRAKIAELFAAWRSGVETCFAEASPRLDPATDPRSLAIFVLSVMEGAVMQARVERSLDPFDRSIAILRHALSRFTSYPPHSP